MEETVSGKSDATVPNTVRAILSADLTLNAFKQSKRRKSKKGSSVLNQIKNTIADTKETKKNAANAKAGNLVAVPAPLPVPTQKVQQQQYYTDPAGNQFLLMPINMGANLQMPFIPT